MITPCRLCGKPFDHTRGWRVCGPCHRSYMKEAQRRYRKSPTAIQRTQQQRADAEWVDRQRERGREYWRLLRHKAIMQYGGYRCACCGESEPKFLTLDHIHNNGGTHRKEIGNRGSGIFKWLRDNDYPPGFQVLCMNCNHGKALNGGTCPHKASPCKPREFGETRDPATPSQAQ